MKKKKIVFISVSVANYNGIFLNELIKKLRDYAEIYIIYCPKCKGYIDYKRDVPEAIADYPKVIKADGFSIFNNSFTKSIIKSPDSVLWYFVYYKNLDRILEEIDPDLVQTSLYFMPYSWQAYCYCARKNIPILISEEIQREPHFAATRILNRLALSVIKRTMIKKASYLISSTKKGVEFQGSFLAKKNKVVQIPWPVEENKFLPFKRIKNKSKSLRLLCVGRLVPYKDFDTIIESLSLLKKKNIPFHLTIKGFGPSESSIRRLIEANNLEENVTLITQMVDFEKMRTLYLSSDLLILASKYEPYGLVVPEAMACGCGIIISDTCGTEFMVENGRNGYIFKTEDAKDLARKIELSIGKTEEFGKYSRHLMKAKFSTDAIIEDYIRLLKKAGI